MALASAAVVLPAAAVALMAMALQLSAAAATAPPPPALIGQPGCNTTCVNVSVLYPFGFGPSHCYWPGLNLTCDTSHDPPRLLLGDGSLRVAEISLWNQTVRVMRTGYIINTTGDLTSPGWNASLDFGRGFREHGYLLSARNELVVAGCDVMATFSADIVGEQTTKIVSGCASFCIKSDGDDNLLYDHYEVTDKVCSGTSGCCLAPLSSSGVPVPNGVQARWLYSGNHTSEQITLPVMVFVAEQGWVEEEMKTYGFGGEMETYGFEEAPLLLDFAVTQGLPLHSKGNNSCSQDVQRMVCKSEHSECVATYPGYACYCKDGTEKSDVYSFGVILVELLTRKKPFLYLSSEGDGLVSHFVNLLSEGNLSQIIDPQVMEEGGTEVQEIATLAASCINSRVEERPTMRQVEHTLHGLQGPNWYNRDGIVAMEPRNDNITTDNPSLSGQGQRYENPCSRRYSLEQEMMMSASYPR